MERRVLLAAMLSAVFLALYSQALIKWSPPLTSRSQGKGTLQRSAERIEPMAEQRLIPQLIDSEDIKYIESDQLRVEIGASSGAIRAVMLNRFKDSTKTQPIRFGGTLPLLAVRAGGQTLEWEAAHSSFSEVSFQSKEIEGGLYQLKYSLDKERPVVVLSIKRVGVEEPPDKKGTLYLYSTWRRGSGIDDHNNRLEAVIVTQENAEKEKHKRYFSPIKHEKVIPRGTSLWSLSEQYFCQSIKPSHSEAKLSLVPSTEGFISSALSELFPSSHGTEFTAEVYYGPRDYFLLKRAGFENAFPIGIIGQIGLILLVGLSGIASVTKSYGLAIVLFSALVTVMTAPFTLLSIRSMKKMQELKPKVDKIMAQYKGDPTKANKEVFSLYKEHKVSPLSGCLPMLLQMPIFIALFQAISHFIELRGKSFLWIDDLSLPDRIAMLPFSIPLIGNELNLLPIIMAIAMYMQSRFSASNMPSDQPNPAAKLMSGPMMSIIFGVMFYKFSSGLVLYWLTNSLTSMALYRMAK